MRHTAIVLLAAGLLPMAASARSGVERWSAASKTATAITGDIQLSPTRLIMANGAMLPLAVDSDPKAFGTSSGPQAARILKVTKPADPKLLNGNTLCGAPVRWIAVYRGAGGKELNLAAFSGMARPTGENGTGLCGTFLYSR